MLRVLGKDVERAVGAHTEALALTGGVGDQSAVTTEDAAARIDEVARLGRDAAELAQEAHIVPVGDEADVLRVGLLRVFKAEVCGEGADLRLAVFADGKQQMRELALRHLVEHIALILVRVHAAQEQVTARRSVEADAGVVPGGNIVEAVVERPVEHRTELQLAVAVQTGVRGAARAVFRDKMPHDLAAEKVAQVEHLMGDAHLRGDARGLLDVVGAAAGAGTVLIMVQLQRDAGNSIALPLQQEDAGGAVHAARHTD